MSVPGSSWLDWETQPIGFGLEALLAACLIDGDQGEITDCLLEKILNMSLGGDTLVQSAKLLSTGAYCGDGEGPAGAKWQAKRCEWDTNNHDWENFENSYKYRLAGGGLVLTVEQEAPAAELDDTEEVLKEGTSWMHLKNHREGSEKHLGGILEASRRRHHGGGILEASGRHLGGIREASTLRFPP